MAPSPCKICRCKGQSSRLKSLQKKVISIRSKMSKQHILIIDDEGQIRRLLTITLESNSYKVLEAATGKEGIAMVSKNTPDLVLLDLGLPDENGHDVLRHLREWYSNPIIIISVQSAEDDIV